MVQALESQQGSCPPGRTQLADIAGTVPALEAPARRAGPLWSRNHDLVTGLRIFGDKNQMIDDNVNDISIGRRAAERA